MKLSITDKFLWDVYRLLEIAGDVSEAVLRSQRTLYRLGSGPQNPIIGKYRKEIGRRKFNKLVFYLKSHNYIEVESLKSNQGIILTREGISKALKTSFKLEEKEKRKDGKWLMLVFDIPSKDKKSRHLLRSVLENLGYKLFQQSVWITPYDVLKKTENSLQFYSLEKFVKIFLIEEM